MKLNDNDSMFNPIINRCSSKHCRKIFNLRDETFLAKFPKTPIRSILIILKNWILENKNIKAIYNIIKDKIENYDVSQIHINEILNEARLLFAHYLKDKYNLQVITEIRKNKYGAIDEFYFINVDNKNLWVTGAINTSTKKLYMEVSFEKIGEIMKKFLYTHIQTGNCIVSDDWPGDRWLNTDPNYRLSAHKHDHGDFGYDPESISHIELVWLIYMVFLKDSIFLFQIIILFYFFE